MVFWFTSANRSKMLTLKYLFYSFDRMEIEMPDTQLTDQQGIGFLTTEFSKIGCILNEYHREVGIDCIIEIREKDYSSSGKIIALQIKSGESYFSNETNEDFFVYIDKEHIDYWLRCILPVMFCIYSPGKNMAFYAIINKKTLILTGKMYKIRIEKSSTIPGLTKTLLLQQFTGRLISEIECKEIFTELKNTKEIINSVGKSLNLLELYVNGITEMCSALFFGTDLVTKLAEEKTPCGMKFSFPSNDMYDKYFHLLNYYNLIEGDFVFELSKINSGILPIFLKPFSINGFRLNDYIQKQGIELYERLFVSSSNNYLTLLA